MITPKIPPKEPKHVYKLLIKILIFDALMRLTPPLSIFAVSVAAVAAYKASPTKAKRKMKSAATDIRQKLSDWIKPDADDTSDEADWSINRDNPEYVFNENDPIVQDAKKNMEKREADDKSYPPETE
jgi:hypothetical protein